jgi:hypothetical protein
MGGTSVSAVSDWLLGRQQSLPSPPPRCFHIFKNVFEVLWQALSINLTENIYSNMQTGGKDFSF